MQEINLFIMSWLPLILVAALVIILGTLFSIASRMTEVREKTGGLSHYIYEIQKVLEAQHEAQQKAQQNVKWEYCVITVLSDGRIRDCKFYYLILDTDTSKEKLVEGSLMGQFENEHDVERLIARLGYKGWEMVVAGNGPENGHCLYFKRPRR